MANTQVLKKLIEPELKKKYLIKVAAEEINISTQEKNIIFLGMEPDVIGYNKNNRILYIGECSASGYLGSSRGNWHRGGAFKTSEIFAKAVLINSEKFKREIIRKAKRILEIDISNIKCAFIIPKGAAFIKAIGYRSNYFDLEILDLYEINLKEDTKKIMLDCLENARKEMG